MDWLQVVVLALLQGLTEFLPVSSSAHLILVPALTGWPDQGLAFDVALHFGSLFAVLLYFRRDLINMTGSWTQSLVTRKLNDDARLAWGVLFATIPVGLAGLAFKDEIELYLRSPFYLALGLVAFGLLLGWVDWRFRGSRTVDQMTWKDVLVIGCAQALALFPGTSRAGITITAALVMGMSREAASRFSFLLSIPVILLACLLKTKDLVEAQVPVEWGAMALGVLVSAISAFLCIHYFLVFIKRIGMQPFVIYRIILGIALLVVFY